MDIKSPSSLELQPMTNEDVLPITTPVSEVPSEDYYDDLDSKPKKNHWPQITLIVLGLVILTLALFSFLSQPANPSTATTNSTTTNSTQVAAVSPSASPAALLSPTPVPAASPSTQTPGVLSLGSAGGSGSTSGGGSSTSSTSLTTDNKYNYYTTANGQVVMTTPTPTATPTPTPNPTPTANPTPTPSNPTPTPTTNPTPIPTANPTPTPAPSVLGATATFSAKVDYATGSVPYAITSADFNGDGKKDLAVPNVGDNTVSVLKGNGNGTFIAKVDFATGSTPYAIAAADFNGDGKQDLVVANASDNTVSILKGNGNGTFVAKVDFATGSAPESVTVADFNGDGKPDLAIANAGADTVSILMGNGDATFVAKVDYAVHTTPRSVTAADFNGDGKPDLAVADGSSGDVSILINNGNGTFAAKVDYTVGSNPYSVTSADFNGDGKRDLAVANVSSNNVSILMGNGNGTFVAKVDYTTSNGPACVTAADFNGDGKPDLVTSNTGFGNVSVFMNNGNGTFAARTDYTVGGSPYSVTAADFNGDGEPDIAVSNAGNSTVSILLNNNPLQYFADNVIGQGTSGTSFTTRAAGTSATALRSPYQPTIDTVHHRLFIADYNNNRVLEYNLDSNNNLVDYTADHVLGQTNFTSSNFNSTNSVTPTQSGMWNPRGLAYDPTGDRLFVADGSNGRVLIFNTGTITDGMNASAVLGQATFTTRNFALTQSGLSSVVRDLAYDSARQMLFVVDNDNKRVMVFNVASPTNGENASYVIGQSGFTVSVGATTASGMNYPNGATYDAANHRLFVSDSYDQRVLIYNLTSLSSTPSAVNVIGQTDFTSSGGAVTQDKLSSPYGVAYDSSRNLLYVVGNSSHRVTIYDVNPATITNGELAKGVIGQSSYTTNTSGTSQTALSYPVGVVFDATNTRLYLSEEDNNRILIYNNTSPVVPTVAANSFYYATAPSSGTAGSASTVFKVGAKDVSGNVITPTSDTIIYLYSSGSGGTFSATSGGTYTSALAITIVGGNPTADFYYKNNSTAGSPYTLTASDNASAPDGGTGIVDTTTSYTLNAGTATVANLTPSTQTVAAGVASSVVTLTTRDSLGNPSNVASSTPFALSSTGTGGQFATDSEFTNIVTSVTVTTSTATFYYRNNTAGSYTITAHAASGFSDGTAGITVNPAAISQYYYATAPGSGAAGAASTVFIVGAHDAFGNVVTVGSNQIVYLYSSAPAGTFSNTTDAGPFTATSTTITTGNTTANFYYKNNSTSGSPYTLTASDNSSAPDGATGIVDATTAYSVTAGSATTSSLTPSSQSVTAGSASSVITLTTKDSLGNPTPVGSNTTFTLSSTGAGDQFATDSGFTNIVSSVTVNATSSTATFFYRNNTAGGYTITAHNAGFSPDSTTSVTVGSAAIASYYFVSAPTSANISVASGAFVVGAHDVFGNVVTVASNTTVYLYSTSGTGTFSNTTSTGPFTATTVTILAGNATATFYYKDATAGAYTLTASEQTPTPTPDTGATNATTAFTVFNPDVLVGPNMPLPSRSATVSDSRPGDPNVHFSWNSSSVNTIKGIRILVCDNGLSNTACTVPTGSNFTTTTLTSTGGQLGVSGWSLSVVNPHEILITNATGAATTIGGTSTLDLTGFVGPTSIGTYFFRIMTYTTTAALPGDSVSYGAIGASTNRSLTVTGDVAESLVFRVANSVASDCSSQTDIADPNDAASDLVTLSPNPMTMTTTSIGTAQMCATSNAEHGYTITYHDAALGGATKGFYNGSHEFAVANLFTSTQGTEQFGFNLRANTTPAVGFDPDGNGLVADLTNADYGTTDRFSYNDTGTPTILAQKSAPNAATARYTMSYIANIASTTPGGTYKAHQIFVITATF